MHLQILFFISVVFIGQLNAQSPTLILPGIINTGLYERDFCTNKEGNEIYFTVQHPKSGYSQIQITSLTDEGWSEPEVVSFSGEYADLEPFISPDGQKLYFSSNRPTGGVELDSVPRRDFNIWYVTKTESGWSNPVALDGGINKPYVDEFYPSVSAKGTLFFTATYPNGIGKEDIYYAKFVNGKYGVPQPMDTAINSKRYEFNAWVSPDEDCIIFTSYGRTDDMGGGDLYMSTKDKNGKWQKAKNLGPKINSKSLDYCPYVSPDGKTFYFTSERMLPFNQEHVKWTGNDFKKRMYSSENGNGDIYSVSFEEILKQ